MQTNQEDQRIRPAGLEPATDGLENRCSIQLSYERIVPPNRSSARCARQDSNLRPAV